jgi:hypothetical protein
LKIRRVLIGTVLGVSAFLLSVAPAAAQSGVQFAAGYQYLKFLEDGGDSVPGGWGASISGGKTAVKFVADFGGHYEDGGSLHTYQGGVEFAGKNEKVTPFVRGLVGGGTFSDGRGTAFIFTPEFGVRFMGPSGIGMQVAAGFPIMNKDDDTQTTFRLFVGVVIK